MVKDGRKPKKIFSCLNNDAMNSSKLIIHKPN